MLVSAAPFYVFLAVVCLFYWLGGRWRPVQLALLALANLFFLAHFSLIYLALPLAATVDFLVGMEIGRSQRPALRRMLLGISLAVNMCLLMTVKLVPLLTGGRF